MIFAKPQPFREAIQSRQVRQILPTEFRTALLDEIPSELRERAFFSAGVQNAGFLERASTAVDELLAGTTDRATQRAGLRQMLAQLQVFPDAERDDALTDLTSDARLNLILDTNLEMAQGYGQWKQGQDEAVLDQWPAQELIRARDSKVPRDWAQRWSDAGGRFFGGRMIALKNDPIWTRISRFGLPYPPFDFNSGMDVQDIDRTEAVALGLISRDARVQPQDRDFDTDMQASVDVRDQSLRAAITDHFRGRARFDAQGVLRAS